MELNVLVVDDSQTVRSMISKALQLAELPVAHCFEAANGKEALEILADRQVDVALVDVNMPVMDGEQLVQKMDEDSRLREIPIILLTSEGRTGRIESLRAKRAWEYLRKPVTPEQIQQVLTSLTRRGGEEPSRERWEELFCRLVQKVGFVICDVAPKTDVSTDNREFLQSRVAFDGSRKGEIVVALPKTTCIAIAGNIAGSEPREEDANSFASDALAELTSVVCGHYLSALWGEGGTFRVGTPKVERLAVEASNDLLACEETTTFWVDDGPALVSVRFTG